MVAPSPKERKWWPRVTRRASPMCGCGATCLRISSASYCRNLEIAMERKLFQAAVGLAWLALPLTALNYWRDWDRLPLRIAVHFDANWQPNGWTSREGSRMLALGMTAFLLVIFTVAAYAARRMATSSLSQWALVAVFYVVLG